MSEICTAEIGEQHLETGTLCAICGEFIPIPDVRQTVFPICEECRRRAKKLLYPEEAIVDVSGLKGGVVFAAVGDKIGTKHAINVKYLQET